MKTAAFLACGIAALLFSNVAPVEAGNRAPSGASTSSPTQIGSATGETRWLTFDGELLTSTTIGALANDPVIAWGPVLDPAGREVPGQIWLVVGKSSKAIYYQLDEEHASGSASYSGYAVMTKAVQTQTIANFETGADVPLIGNDHDAFVTSSSELFVRSDLLEGGLVAQSLDGQPVEVDPLLVNVGTIVSIANIPAATSGARLGAYRFLASDGTLLHESRSLAIASGGSASCASFGAGVGASTEDGIEAISDAAQALQWTVTGTYAFTTSLGFGPVASFGSGYAAGQLNRQVLGPLTEGVESIQRNVWVPLLGSLAEGACNLSGLGDDLQAGASSIELLTVESTCSMTSICTSYEQQVIGSTSSNGTTQGPDGTLIESVEVNGVVGDECVESTVALVCEEW